MSMVLSERVSLQESAAENEGLLLPAGADLRLAIGHAQQGLLSLQQEDGHWCAELEGDSILESEYVLVLYFLGLAEPERIRMLAETIRCGQRPEGGWANYEGGTPDVSASVKAYIVLKLVGDDPEAPHMKRAQATICQLGGVEACNSFTKIYLSIFGLYNWRRCPAVPPELILLPRWFYFNVNAMSAWSRAIVVPLSIIWAHKPQCDLPLDGGIDELWSSEAVPPEAPLAGRARRWSRFFRAVNGVFQALDRIGFWPLRARALKRAEDWVLDRLVDSDGLGAIFPPIINMLIAFRCLGYEVDDPVMHGQLQELQKLEVIEDGAMRVQPCFSAVWDTAIAVDTLGASGASEAEPTLRTAVRWLMAKEVDRPGDVQAVHPDVPIGGWYFEYANAFYPDCDDTAEVLKALSRVTFDDAAEDESRRQAMKRGVAWLLAMQNRDGGWAAFDRGCDREILTYIPFADHNAMIDPSTSDITARVVEILCGLGLGADHPAILAGLGFLRRSQEPDGSWYGRWGCNYLYGTWLASQAMAAAGAAEDRVRLERAGAWLRSCQNSDGGWGELPRSYDDSTTKGQGPSTAAQTAWALMGLAAAAAQTSRVCRCGLRFLLDRQRADGTWNDEHWTGTGFPKVFYLRYHLYATYFPLGALAVFAGRANRAEIESRTSAHGRAA